MTGLSACHFTTNILRPTRMRARSSFDVGVQRLVLPMWGDNTPVCLKQMCSCRDRPDDFAALDGTIVGISAQDLDSHQGFIDKNSLTVPLLADVDKRRHWTLSEARRQARARSVHHRRRNCLCVRERVSHERLWLSLSRQSASASVRRGRFRVVR